MTASAPGAESGTREELLAIESARRAAVNSTRRPGWLHILFALMMGLAFGFAILRTPVGWIVAAVILVLGMLGFLLIDTRLKRRRGRLLNLSGRSALRFFMMYATIFAVGQIQPPVAWQPWFAVAAGVAVAAMGYTYLRWEDADTARKLASGDFDPNDLMP